MLVGGGASGCVCVVLDFEFSGYNAVKNHNKNTNSGQLSGTNEMLGVRTISDAGIGFWFFVFLTISDAATCFVAFDFWWLMMNDDHTILFFFLVRKIYIFFFGFKIFG